MSTEALRAEHDALLSQVQTRASTLHFAHAAVSFFLTISLLGSAWRLSSDGDPVTWWGTAVVLGALAGLYCLVRAAFAVKHYRVERGQVSRLLALREQLGLDAPIALPGRA